MSEAYLNILAMDTSTTQLHLAVQFGGDRSVKLTEAVPGTHGQVLLKKIDDLLTSAGVMVGDLQAVAVSLGPGSFTGLRIGLAAAKGIAVANGIPIVGVSLFEVAALHIQGTDTQAHVLIPSRKGEFYVGTYRDRTIKESDIAIVAETHLSEQLKDGHVYAIGFDPGIVAYAAPGVTVRPMYFDAGDLLRVGLEKLGREEFSDLSTLEPIYLQKAIAEIRFDQKHGSK